MEKVQKEQFQLIEGEEFLGLYEQNTRTTKHDFCIRYTMYTFHHKQRTPDFFCINAHCLDDPAIGGVSYIQTDGVGVSLEGPS